MDQIGIEDVLRELKKLRRLEVALRDVVENKSQGSGYLAHADDCDSYHAWGPDALCDCHVFDVHQALDALKGTALDDIVEALEAE